MRSSMESRTDEQYLAILRDIAQGDDVRAARALYDEYCMPELNLADAFDLPHEVQNAICEMSEASCPYAEKQLLAAKVIAAGVDVQLALLIDFGCWSYDDFMAKILF